MSAPLVRLGIRVRPDRAETALADLLPVLAAGAEERVVDGCVEYAVYGLAGELPAVEQVRALAGDAVVDVVSSPVADGWERRWHEFLRPVSVGELVVRPPWVDGSADDLLIDPDVLFGAGTHPTTRLCLRLLQDEAAGGALCDWGAGSGVLAVAAARLGFGPVTAVEVDGAALDVIARNAALNRVEIATQRLDLCRSAAPWAPTVVANLPRPLLVEVAALPARPPERLLASGMLAAETDEVVAAFGPLGLREERRIEEEGWAGVVLS